MSRKTLRKALCVLASYSWIGFWLSSLASNMYDFWSFTFDQTRNSYSLSLNSKESREYRGAQGHGHLPLGSFRKVPRGNL